MKTPRGRGSGVVVYEIVDYGPLLVLVVRRRRKEDRPQLDKDTMSSTALDGLKSLFNLPLHPTIQERPWTIHHDPMMHLASRRRLKCESGGLD